MADSVFSHFTSKWWWWYNCDGYSSDSCAFYFSSPRANNEALSPPVPLPLPSASGQNIAFPPVALWVTIGLAVCLLVLLIALAAVCRRKIKESCEEARREGEANRGGQSCTLFLQGVQFVCHSCVPNHTLLLVDLNAVHFIAVHSFWGRVIPHFVILHFIEVTTVFYCYFLIF